MKRVTLLVMVLGMGLAVLFGGCSTTQKGAAAGGAAGAAVGSVWATHASAAITTAQGALIGGAGGTATGALVGDQFDQADARDAKRDVDNLRAQLTERENELAQLKSGSDPQVSELQGKNQELGAKVDELSKAKTDADGQNVALNDQIKKLEGEAQALRDEIGAKENRLASLQTSVQQKDGALDNLKKQLSDLNVQLEETNRGLTLTILDQLLFEPGKAEMSPEGQTLISKVSDIIQAQFPGREIVVEGHTDNQPIKHSGWKSNWELGSARALAVVHRMVEKQGFEPGKISAVSFGEFRPAADNSTADGRRLNRRSVIVIMPEKMPLQKQVANAASSQ